MKIAEKMEKYYFLLGLPLIGLLVGLAAIWMYLSTWGWIMTGQVINNHLAENWTWVLLSIQTISSIVFWITAIKWVIVPYFNWDEPRKWPIEMQILMGLVGNYIILLIVIFASLLPVLMCYLPIHTFFLRAGDEEKLNEFLELVMVKPSSTFFAVGIILAFHSAAGLLYGVISLPFKSLRVSPKTELTVESETDAAIRNSVITPLHLAVKKSGGYGILGEVRALIEAGADINAFEPENGDTPLHLAVRSLDIPLIELLVSKGARLDIKNRMDGPLAMIGDEPGQTPVQLLETIYNAASRPFTDESETRREKYMLSSGSFPNDSLTFDQYIKIRELLQPHKESPDHQD